MKFIDILREESTPITEKQKNNARKIYKAHKVGLYKPFNDAEFRLKYILPDFEEHQIYDLSNEGKVMMFTDLSKIDMSILKSEYFFNEIPIRNPKDINGGVVGNIVDKIKSKFLHYGIVMMIKDL